MELTVERLRIARALQDKMNIADHAVDNAVAQYNAAKSEYDSYAADVFELHKVSDKDFTLDVQAGVFKAK